MGLFLFMNRDFKGVWIPKEVWLDDKLSWMEKLFLVEIDSLDGKPFFFVKQEDCFKYVDDNLEGLKQFGRNTFPTANSVERILCAPKIQKEI